MEEILYTDLFRIVQHLKHYIQSIWQAAQARSDLLKRFPFVKETHRNNVLARCAKMYTEVLCL